MDVKYKIFLETFYDFSQQSKYVEIETLIEYLVKEQMFSEVEVEELIDIARYNGKILEQRPGFFVRA